MALAETVKDWVLRTLKGKLIKIGAKVVGHSRYVIFQMPEVAVSRSRPVRILTKKQEIRITFS